MSEKLISIVTSCYNESGNIQELYDRIKAVMEKIPAYTWELIIADNFSNEKNFISLASFLSNSNGPLCITL